MQRQLRKVAQGSRATKDGKETQGSKGDGVWGAVGQG